MFYKIFQYLPLVLFLLLISPDRSYAALDIYELNQRGIKALNKDNYKVAIHYFELANKARPNNEQIQKNLIIAYNSLALDHAHENDIDMARHLFRKALKLSKLDTTTYNNYFATLNNQAVKLVEKDKFSEADELFKELALIRNFTNNKKLASACDHNYISMLVLWSRESNRKGDSKKSRELLYRALSKEPGNVDVLQSLGDVCYDSDLYGLAQTYYERAIEIDPKEKKYYQERIKRCKGEAEFEKNAHLLQDKKGYFKISYTNDVSKKVVELLLDTLMESYRHHTALTGVKPPLPIRVKIYDSKEFYTLHGLPHWAGGFYDGKLRIPAKLMHRTELDVRQVVYHEMTHVFLNFWLGDDLEFWLHEGLAQYFEPVNKLTWDEKKYARKAVQFSRYKFDQIRLTHYETFTKPDEAREAYVHAKAFVKYLIDTRGFDKMRQFLNLIAEKENTDDAMKKCFGALLEDLHVEWRKWGRKNY